MPDLRPGVVYLDGLYRIVGPASRRTLYAHPDRARVYAVRELFAHVAQELLDPEDGNEAVFLNDEVDPLFAASYA